MEDVVHTDEGSPGAVPIAYGQEENERAVQEPPGVIEAPLGSEKRRFEIQPDRKLPRLPGTLAQVDKRALEGLFRSFEVEGHPPCVADKGQRAGFQVFDGLGSIMRDL